MTLARYRLLPKGVQLIVLTMCALTPAAAALGFMAQWQAAGAVAWSAHGAAWQQNWTALAVLTLVQVAAFVIAGLRLALAHRPRSIFFAIAVVWFAQPGVGILDFGIAQMLFRERVVDATWLFPAAVMMRTGLFAALGTAYLLRSPRVRALYFRERETVLVAATA